MSDFPHVGLRIARNAGGQIAELRGYTAEAVLFVRSRFVYDERGRLAQQIEFGEGDAYLGKTLWRYDEKGRVDEKASYKPDGTRDMMTRHAYSDEGYLAEEILYKADGSVFAQYAYAYLEFDDTGNWLRRKRTTQNAGPGGEFTPEFFEYQDIEYYE